MKKITFLALLLISVYAKAGSCSANGDGNWETPGNWSCGHVPGAGDDATIGAGITVTVNANNLANIGNLDIFGTLQFTNGSKINLSTNSIVNVYLGGGITGGNGGAKLVFPSTSYSGSFSTTGPFFFSNSGSGTGILPLTLVSFNSSLQSQGVILSWRTENEANINSFEIESKGDGNTDWQTLGTTHSMAAGEGGYTYTFTDRAKLNGDRYYRLKIVERDGKFGYSKVLFVGSAQNGTISIAPTLAYSTVNVHLPASGQAQISIFNTFGLLVKTMTTATDSFNIDVSGLNRGEYFLKATQGKNSYTTKFIRQ